MIADLYGNPHSASASSQLADRRVEDCRLAALGLFDANPDEFDIIFVANATAGIKLVQEAFMANPRGFWYGYHGHAHTSLVGVREGASAGHRCFHDDEEVDLWIRQSRVNKHNGATHKIPALECESCPTLADQSCGSSRTPSLESMSGSRSSRDDWGSSCSSIGAPSSEANDPLELYAFPAQSNLDGRRLPLSWYHRERDRSNTPADISRFTLLDAAALVPTAPLDLSNADHAPDFTVLSFSKIFGFPDLGALIVRKDAAHVFQHRRYFGGGTVDIATCTDEQWHSQKSSSLHAAWEDGTLPIHSILALDHAIRIHRRLYGSFAHISRHTTHLAERAHDGLKILDHANGAPVCKIYAQEAVDYSDTDKQGPMVACNLRNSQGAWVSNNEVEKLASLRNIHLRSGGHCNPGGMASALQLSPMDLRHNFAAGLRCGGEGDVVNGKPTGMLRVSFGAMSTLADVDAFLAFIREFFVESNTAQPRAALEASHRRSTGESFVVDQLIVYPIKSCAGWRIPSGQTCNILPEGLAWDREWCLLHTGTGEVLNQKKCPSMALIRPDLDFANNVLRVRYAPEEADHQSPHDEISIPLAAGLSQYQHASTTSSLCDRASSFCGDTFTTKVYASAPIAAFFTKALGLPCQLARFPPASSSGGVSSMRHAKPYMLADRPVHGETSLLLANESPILVVTTTSLARLNEEIRTRRPSEAEVPAAAFRPNIVLAAAEPTSATPFAEDQWRSIQVLRAAHVAGQNFDITGPRFDVLGPCRRCQMVCINQRTAQRRDEPFVTLAKTRRREGKVWFGVHARLTCCSTSRSASDVAHDCDNTDIASGVFTIRTGDQVMAE